MSRYEEDAMFGGGGIIGAAKAPPAKTVNSHVPRVNQSISARCNAVVPKAADKDAVYHFRQLAR